MERTVTTHFTRAILKLIDDKTLVPDSRMEYWKDLHNVNNRLSLSVADDIWAHTLCVCNDELFGLRAGLNIHIGDLDIVGYLLMSCNTFYDAIEALREFHPLIGEGGDFGFRRSEDSCGIIYSANYDICCEQRIMAAMGSLINFTKWLTDGAFVPLSICLTHSPPSLASIREAENLVGCEIFYGKDINILSFDVAMLSLPLVQSNEQVYARMYALVNESMENLPSSSFSYIVRRLIRKHPAKAKDEIANKLAMSGRHLNRKLGREGVNFKILQDKVRLELAEVWLRENVHTQDIADRFGLSDAQSFFKAFKRWSGQTPSEFLRKNKAT